ncbi:MAG: RsmB/NOP family class I SAM-dependent RNA methyltransferase, partial [Lachnospiraceae bacterium]|nr:RsmB/NOP family class I SAM-dependent RNA methyltransferase [Lachnospiraceae bacterium]
MDDKKIILPKEFIDSVRDLLGGELDAFVASYEKERCYGLRRNQLKYSKEDFEESMPFDLEPVAWADEGYYYKEEERPGKHALHEGGAYYIQEPSAMSAVAMLDPKPRDVVADLCAAPGGKSTQIAGRMDSKGLLVSNEYVKDRAKILSSNIERMGISNALVLNESTDSLAGRFPSFFDKVLVDAPCSGEGMFRKEENAIPEWSLENTKMCHERQLMILDNSAQMLKAGGTLVYSTCTFNSLENEGSVNEFLSKHPEFSLVESKRLWPHKDKGEGHFVAKFLKQGTLTPTDFSDVKVSKSVESLTLQVKDFLLKEIGIKEEKVSSLFEGRTLATFGDNIYLLPP